MSIEQHGTTEKMRHVPPLEWLLERLRGAWRERLDKLAMATISATTEPPPSEEVREAELLLRRICGWLQTLVQQIRGRRPERHSDSDLHVLLLYSMDQCTAALETLDSAAFRCRTPFHEFETSEGEAIYEQILIILALTGRLEEAVARFDPDISFRLMESLLPPMSRVALKDQPAESMH